MINYVELKCKYADGDYLIIQQNKEKDNYVIWMKENVDEIFVNKNQLKKLIENLEEMINE